MRFLKHIFTIALTLLLLFCFTACDDTEKAYIYFRLPEKPTTLDPQTAQSDAELLIIRNVFEGLLRKDQNGDIVCGVAQSYKKDGLTYIFTLRDDAKWSDGNKITANDFVYALRRAVNPKTKSPFVSRLFCIESAENIYKGNKKISSLGVKALNDSTLQITLSRNDKNFEETLTTSVAMPCNQDFFNSCGGKYGLFSDTLLSNGSYRLAKWGKEIFGIRLYRNKEYSGQFTAKNAAVFFSHDDKISAKEVLLENDADIAFINCTDTKEIQDAGYKIASYDNICWFITISDGFSKGIRKSLLTLSNHQVFEKDLAKGYSVANSIFPTALNIDSNFRGMLVYDLEKAKRLFKNEIEYLKDKKFPEDVVLYYYDDGFSKTVVTDIVGHWQNNLGAFINIESVSSPEILLSQLKKQTYAMCIFPVTAESPLVNEYLEKFGKNKYSSNAQSQLLETYNLSPLMFQSTTIAYGENLSGVDVKLGNGCLDFSFIVKKDD